LRRLECLAGQRIEFVKRLAECVKILLDQRGQQSQQHQPAETIK
jgi:hypothetical protein